jgi:serine/threonine protein kinase
VISTTDADSLDTLLRALATPPAALVDPSVPGKLLGRYRLQQRLGHGGFGVVYEAEDEVLERTVAIKVMRPAPADSQRALRFKREALLLARLHHRNVVTLYDYGVVDGVPYLVLERLRGETLEQRRSEGQLGARAALAIAVDVARGLAHAHQAGIVHADVKPSNVFLCDDGTVKLLDFGLGRWHASATDELVGGGTPAYMSPEQWRREPPTPASDVFATGALLYQLLTGRLPFRDDDKGKAPPLSALAGPRGLVELMARALCDDQRARFCDCAELLAALMACAGRRSSAPRAHSAVPRRRPRWSRMRPTALMMIDQRCARVGVERLTATAYVP